MQRASAGDPFAIRNALAHHDAFLDLIDHPKMLPLVVDAIGWNIQIHDISIIDHNSIPKDWHPAPSARA
ncbi:MAG: hypothetical protein R2932_21175 [Caldilineaceae bacterium]